MFKPQKKIAHRSGERADAPTQPLGSVRESGMKAAADEDCRRLIWEAGLLDEPAMTRKSRGGTELKREYPRFIIHSEETGNKMDRTFNEKEMALEEAQKKIESTNRSLKKKEKYLDNQLSDVVAKEEKAESLRSRLKTKEELLAMADILGARERVPSFEQIVLMDRKRQEFDLEMAKRRKLLLDEIRSKAEAVRQKEAEINHVEEKLGKREQALEKKSERLEEKEKDLEAKLKTSNEKEKSIKAEAKRLEVEMKQMLSIKDELYKLRAEISRRELQILEEKETLRISEEEKAEHLRLMLELKEEIEQFRLQKELFLKETEFLKQDRKKFEEEWEVLDDKNVSITNELRQIDEEKEKLEKLRHSEEEQLQNESITTNHEHSVPSEKAQSEGSQLLREFELKSRDLETGFANRQEEMEKHMHDISYLKGAVQREIEEMRSQRRRMEKENQEVALKKKQLEAHQLEMRRDIDELNVLSKSLRINVNKFVEERGRFVTFVEQLNSCNNCGDITREFVLSDLQLLDLEDGDALLFPRLIAPAVDRINMKSDSGGHKSWIRKCTSTILKLSPTKMIHHDQNPESPLSAVEVGSAEKTDMSTMLVDVEDTNENSIAEEGQEPSGCIANDTFDFQQLLSGSVIREVHFGSGPSIDNQSIIDSKMLGSNQHKHGRKPKVGHHRMHSVKAAVEDGKIILDTTMHEPHPNEDSRGNSDHVEKAAGTTARKQPHAQMKRRQTVAPDIQTGQEKLYNFLQSRAAAKASADIKKKKEKQDDDGNGNAVPNAEVLLGSSLGRVIENGNTNPEFPSGKVVRFEPATDVDENADAAKLGENVGLNEEVNGASEYDDMDDFDEDSDGFDGDGDIDHIDDEPKHPGQALTTKKVWKFFTT
ncbi:Protein CROWDED NUCLEI like [Actinidia chinensis var. chinensis]|uniref:Protein CROWDED NUCLEI like n=1 Tax=Actinidia chinensis var. chinensis TaxID=1590841 RepID=A0A2R6QQN1_ACTCC|nr:Protein CROWDED NUCLEI like [Actinidia chinensis var. chinensis]